MNYAGVTQHRNIFGKTGTRVMDMRPQVKATSTFKALGDKQVFKVVALREYDEDGVIVAPAASLNPSDYADHDAYEAALAAAGHSLKPTWDFLRYT